MSRTAPNPVFARPCAPGDAIVLWISNDPPPEDLARAIAGRCRIRPISLGDSITGHLDGVTAAVISPGEAAPGQVARVLAELKQTPLVGLLIGDLSSAPQPGPADGPSRIVIAPPDAPAAALAAQLTTLLQLQPAISALQAELEHARKAGGEMDNTFGQIEEEMRLAARLQRDFLPKQLPDVGSVAFSVMFRPASWVSGDIYDVLRLDETQTGFYVADAVGHGMPAALLTMFIKQALPTKRIAGRAYEIIAPDNAMIELNRAICDQGLSSCQFCTAVYGIIDSKTLDLTYARGGHPEPLLLGADGTVAELDAPGTLLGVFEEATFELGRVRLSPGDRIVLHSDGAECVFRNAGSSGRDEFVEAVVSHRHLPIDEFVFQLSGLIDNRQGSLHPEDDVTILVVEASAE